MATNAEKVAPVASTDHTNSSVEENPNKNVDTDQEKKNAAAFNSAAVGVKKYAEDSKMTVTTVGTLSGNEVPVTDAQKKIRRAERFGMQVQLSEEEKRNSRAERFGMGYKTHGSEVSKTLEELKRKARAERFGLPVPSSVGDEEAKRKARLARFAPYPQIDSLEEDKRKARVLRFSETHSGSMSQVNGKGNIQPKAAITGKAGGGD